MNASQLVQVLGIWECWMIWHMYQVRLSLALASLVADNFHHTPLHQDKLKAAVESRAKHLLKTILWSGEKKKAVSVCRTPPPKAVEPPLRLPQISRGKVEGSGSQPERSTNEGMARLLIRVGLKLVPKQLLHLLCVVWKLSAPAFAAAHIGQRSAAWRTPARFSTQAWWWQSEQTPRKICDAIFQNHCYVYINILSTLDCSTGAK